MAAMSTPNALPPQHLLVSGLTLTRGGRMLFANLDLRLGYWDILLIRGPNGAGKSSLLLVLAGILRPDRGQISWPGGEPQPVHVIGHAPGIKTTLTVAENLDFWRQANGPSGLAVGAALERVGLGGLGAIEAGHLSAGQTKRLALARLLVSDRKIWLLDEPTASLDTAGAALVGELLNEHTAAGGGAIVATHDTIPQTAGASVQTLGAVA
jgi:heme exporter protein A